MAEPPGADRILVVRLGALGDVVRTLPAVGSLRGLYPGALITWLVEPAAAGVLRGQPGIDDVMVFPRGSLAGNLRRVRPVSLVTETLRFVRELRSPRFDLVVDFHGILKSGILSWLSGAPVRVGYAPPVGREQGWRFANRRAVLPTHKLSRFDRNQALASFLGARPPETREKWLQWEPSATPASGIRVEPGIVIHPGTSPSTPYKRYTVEGYAEVARTLFQRSGIRSWVASGPAPAELEFARRIVDASQGAASLAPATPGFGELAELLAGARVFIGSDSGPLHAASLLGTPVVQILGPTDPVENAPFPGTPSRSLRVPVACSPCRRGCAAATCMRVVPAGRVAAAALELLDGNTLRSAVPTGSAASTREERSDLSAGAPSKEPSDPPPSSAPSNPAARFAGR